MVSLLVQAGQGEGAGEHEHGLLASECHCKPLDMASSRLFSFSECGIRTNGLDMAEGKYHHGSVSSQLTSGSEHDNLTLKLSSAGTMASDNASCMSSGYISGSQDSVTAISFEAATVASQWLQLLYQDVRGRLAGIPVKLSLLTDKIFDQFFNKDIKTFEQFHHAYLEVCNKFNTVMLGQHYEAPDMETIKVFLEYLDLDGSSKARASLHGRKFGENRVVVVYYSENKFSQGDYDG